jgi:hypothetical protein
MKRDRMLLLSAVVVAAQAAVAQQAAPDPKVLGTTEAILAYCSKIDPSGGSKYLERVKRVTQGASDEVLAKVRKSDEYQQAHQSVDDFVGKVDEHNAMKVCSESLTHNK